MGLLNYTTAKINELLAKTAGLPAKVMDGDTKIPSKTSELTNDSQFVKGSELKTVNGNSLLGQGDITIQGGSGGGVADSVEWNKVQNKPSWVNSATKPAYTANEVGALTDAPSDGNTYGRNNGRWVVTPSGGSGGGGGESIDNISLAPLFAACIKSEGSAVTDEDIETMYRYADKYGTEAPIYGEGAYSFSFGALSDATMLEIIEKGMDTTALCYGIFVISKRDSPERQAILGGSVYPQGLLGGIPGFYRVASLVYDLTVTIDLDKKKVESQKLDGLTISSDDKDLIINQAMSMNGTSFSISLSRGGDGTKALMDNGSYKSIAETLFSGVANVSSLSGLPTDKYTIAVKASAASTLSFKSTPKEGMVYNIDILNTGSSDFDQPIPTGANWQSDETKVSCKAGKVTNISVRYILGKYVVRV